MGGKAIMNEGVAKQIADIGGYMEKEGLPMSNEDIEDLARILRGEITFEDLIQPKIDAMKAAGADIDAFNDSPETDAELDRRFRLGVVIMLQEKKRLGLPIARYDYVNRRAYIEYFDGRREYIYRSLSEEKAERDRISRDNMIREEARREGLREGLREVAKALLIKGCPRESIKGVYGLSDEEMQEILKEIEM